MEQSKASALQAFREIGRFWRLLLQGTRPSQILIATVLALMAGLTELTPLVLLIPLLHLLDPAAGSTQDSQAWLPHVLQYLAFHHLFDILQIFLGLVVGPIANQSPTWSLFDRCPAQFPARYTRSTLFRHRARKLVVLRRMRPTDLFRRHGRDRPSHFGSALYALEIPGVRRDIGANVAVAFMIAPALTLLALATGSFLAWLVRSWLAESLFGRNALRGLQ